MRELLGTSSDSRIDLQNQLAGLCTLDQGHYKEFSFVPSDRVSLSYERPKRCSSARCLHSFQKDYLGSALSMTGLWITARTHFCPTAYIGKLLTRTVPCYCDTTIRNLCVPRSQCLPRYFVLCIYQPTLVLLNILSIAPIQHSVFVLLSVSASDNPMCGI